MSLRYIRCWYVSPYLLKRRRPKQHHFKAQHTADGYRKRLEQNRNTVKKMAVLRGSSSASTADNGDSTLNISNHNSNSTLPSDSKAGNGTGNKVSSRGRKLRSSQNGVFNPKLILSQMAALQCFHYFILCVFVQTNSIIFATSVTLDRVFTDRYLNIWTAEGWIDNSAVLLSSITGYVLLIFIF